MNLIVAEDHPIFRQGLVDLLKRIPTIDIIDEAGNGVECLAKMSQQHYDVVITDIEMPEMSGVELLAKVKELYPSVKVIALSSHDSAVFVKALYERGVDGYLVKTTDIQEITRALEFVMRGDQFFAFEVAHKLFKILTQQKYGEVEVTEEAEPFSEREQEILKLICEQKTTKEIAEELNLAIRTVDRHREILMEKTNSKSVVGLVLAAYRNGIVI